MSRSLDLCVPRSRRTLQTPKLSILTSTLTLPLSKLVTETTRPCTFAWRSVQPKRSVRVVVLERVAQRYHSLEFRVLVCRLASSSVCKSFPRAFLNLNYSKKSKSSTMITVSMASLFKCRKYTLYKRIFVHGRWYDLLVFLPTLMRLQ